MRITVATKLLTKQHFAMNEREKKLIHQWVSRSKSLDILIFGKIGVGKSSLINTLLKEQVAEEGSGLYSVTKKVEAYTRTIRPIKTIINDVRVTLWDTPGLRDPFEDGKKTLDAISEVCQDVDLFLFCTRMDQTRLGQDDVDAIRELTETLGEGIWKRAIFALTFANKTSPPSGQPSPDYLTSREQEWQAGFREAVKRHAGSIDVGSIPVVPTGYKEEPLPDGREWFTPFWEACLGRVRYYSIPAFLRIDKDGWFEAEARKKIAARIIAQRLKEIGDSIEKDEINPEFLPLRHDDPEQVLNVLAEAIQNDESNLLSQTSRRVEYVWEYYGTPVTVLIGALLAVMYYYSR